MPSYDFSDGSFYYTIILSTYNVQISGLVKEKYTYVNVLILPSIYYQGNNYIITEIKSEVFSGCTSLQSISIPSSVTQIGNQAFTNCINLQTVIISNNNNLLYIGTVGGSGSTFANCKLLKSITLPRSTILQNNTFFNCTNLTNITFFDNQNTNATTFKNNVFLNCYNLKSIIIPDNVTSIGISAFSNCHSLGQITINNTSNLQTIQDNAFNNCTSLSSIYIPQLVSSIGSNSNGVFRGCTNLSNITVDPQNQNFKSSTNGDLLLTKNEQEIIQFALNYNPNGNYIIPNTVSEIKIHAFAKSVNLTSITIPSSVIQIGSSAFSRCVSLQSVTFLGNNITLDVGVFLKCINLTSINLPTQLQIIPVNAFKDCTNLNLDISLLISLTSIGSYAFKGCRSLCGNTNTNILNLPNSLTSIGNYALQGCIGLSNVILNSINSTTIGDYAFLDC